MPNNVVENVPPRGKTRIILAPDRPIIGVYEPVGSGEFGPVASARPAPPKGGSGLPSNSKE